MKIDRRSSPIIFEPQFSLAALGITHWVSGNSIDEYANHAFDVIFRPCLYNIHYITQPVLMAFDYADKSTISKLLSLRNEINSISRAVIWRAGETTQTTLYNFYKEDGITKFAILNQMTQKQRPPINVYLAGFFNHEDNENLYSVASAFSIPNFRKTEESDMFSVNWVELIVQCEVFLQYAELETKTLGPNQKDSIACKYNNKLPFQITIVDSTWYTELVKSDAFKVRGHFRLQPFGESLSKRKLIWINEFQKDGYHRRAKIQNESPFT